MVDLAPNRLLVDPPSQAAPSLAPAPGREPVFFALPPARVPAQRAAVTRYDAYIGKDWETHGLAHLVVARIRADHTAELAVFLVDMLCLGVKDAFFDSGIPESELEDALARNLPPENERLHPACAKKLVEGAVDYAQSLGFAPARDFRKARKILSGIDAAVCPRDFTFGRDGRPCFVRGPHDDDARVQRVLAILEARCGEDGYDFIDESGAA